MESSVVVESENCIAEMMFNRQQDVNSKMPYINKQTLQQVISLFEPFTRLLKWFIWDSGC